MSLFTSPVPAFNDEPFWEVPGLDDDDDNAPLAAAPAHSAILTVRDEEPSGEVINHEAIAARAKRKPMSFAHRNHGDADKMRASVAARVASKRVAPQPVPESNGAVEMHMV